MCVVRPSGDALHIGILHAVVVEPGRASSAPGTPAGRSVTVNVNGFVAENGEFACSDAGISSTVSSAGHFVHSGVAVVSWTDVATPNAPPSNALGMTNWLCCGRVAAVATFSLPLR